MRVQMCALSPNSHPLQGQMLALAQPHSQCCHMPELAQVNASAVKLNYKILKLCKSPWWCSGSQRISLPRSVCVSLGSLLALLCSAAQPGCGWTPLQRLAGAGLLSPSPQVSDTQWGYFSSSILLLLPSLSSLCHFHTTQGDSVQAAAFSTSHQPPGMGWTG